MDSAGQHMRQCNVAERETICSTQAGTEKLEELYSVCVCHILCTERSAGGLFTATKDMAVSCFVEHHGHADLNSLLESFAESQDY